MTEYAEDAAALAADGYHPKRCYVIDATVRAEGRQEPDRRTRRSVRCPLHGRFRVQFPASGEGNRDNANPMRLRSERGLPC